MNGYCSLDPTINNCPYYIKEKNGCRNNNGSNCGFFNILEQKTGNNSHKEPKWFEKYYKKK